MKAPVERQLLDTLNELDNAIGAKPNLPQIFGHIDELAGELPPSADLKLCHFLQRNSYEKARLFSD